MCAKNMDTLRWILDEIAGGTGGGGTGGGGTKMSANIHVILLSHLSSMMAPSGSTRS